MKLTPTKSAIHIPIFSTLSFKSLTYLTYLSQPTSTLSPTPNTSVCSNHHFIPHSLSYSFLFNSSFLFNLPTSIKLSILTSYSITHLNPSPNHPSNSHTKNSWPPTCALVCHGSMPKRWRIGFQLKHSCSSCVQR